MAERRKSTGNWEVPDTYDPDDHECYEFPLAALAAEQEKLERDLLNALREIAAKEERVNVLTDELKELRERVVPELQKHLRWAQDRLCTRAVATVTLDHPPAISSDQESPPAPRSQGTPRSQGAVERAVEFFRSAPGSGKDALAKHLYGAEDCAARNRAKSMIYYLARAGRIRKVPGHRGGWASADEEVVPAIGPLHPKEVN
jgi:hypothetical protein